jgi:ATP-dependent helicase IRC3
LILAHRDKLIQQAMDKLRLVDPTLPLGVVQATRDEHTAPIVVASVQTLSRRTRLTRVVPDFQAIVIDEARHAPATGASSTTAAPGIRMARWWPA